MSGDISMFIGFAAGSSTIVAFGCRSLIPLRSAAIAANILFLTYGVMKDLSPIIWLHAILLPLNCFRLSGLLLNTKRHE
jgi:hypothetical protein